MEFRFRFRRAARTAADMPAPPAHAIPGPRLGGEPDTDRAGRPAATAAAFAVSVSSVLTLIGTGSTPQTALAVTAACALMAKSVTQRPDDGDGPGLPFRLA